MLPNPFWKGGALCLSLNTQRLLLFSAGIVPFRKNPRQWEEKKRELAGIPVMKRKILRRKRSSSGYESKSCEYMRNTEGKEGDPEELRDNAFTRSPMNYL